jgi:hypothetical protein
MEKPSLDLVSYKGVDHAVIRTNYELCMHNPQQGTGDRIGQDKTGTRLDWTRDWVAGQPETFPPLPFGGEERRGESE